LVKSLRLDRENRKFPRGYIDQFAQDLTDRDIILFDGADELKGLAWIRFKGRIKTAGGLLITSHRDGMLPELIRCSTTEELTYDIVEKLLGRETEQYRGLIHDLYKKHAGNVRDVLREMFDLYPGKTSSLAEAQSTQGK
jgi:hypothetical protein